QVCLGRTAVPTRRSSDLAQAGTLDVGERGPHRLAVGVIADDGRQCRQSRFPPRLGLFPQLPPDSGDVAEPAEKTVVVARKPRREDRKSTRLNSSHVKKSY